MPKNQCIGKVTATESKPTTCTSVYFWLSPDVIIRPFDIVRIECGFRCIVNARITDRERKDHSIVNTGITDREHVDRSCEQRDRSS